MKGNGDVSTLLPDLDDVEPPLRTGMEWEGNGDVSTLFWLEASPPPVIGATLARYHIPHFSLLRPDAAVCFPVIEQAADLLEGDGFRHEEVDAAGEGFALVPAGGEAGQGDDQGRGGGGGARLLDVADGSGGFEAVHDGHADVCGRGGSVSRCG